ncbi:MAG TPA: hypothetical protein VHD32_09785 [Candidatus Didemnitutus sp.]|nr:hypothetical protein [Candidatus Didemnitutus sp.]
MGATLVMNVIRRLSWHLGVLSLAALVAGGGLTAGTVAPPTWAVKANFPGSATLHRLEDVSNGRESGVVICQRDTGRFLLFRFIRQAGILFDEDAALARMEPELTGNDSGFKVSTSESMAILGYPGLHLIYRKPTGTVTYDSHAFYVGDELYVALCEHPNDQAPSPLEAEFVRSLQVDDAALVAELKLDDAPPAPLGVGEHEAALAFLHQIQVEHWIARAQETALRDIDLARPKADESYRLRVRQAIHATDLMPDLVRLAEADLTASDLAKANAYLATAVAKKEIADIADLLVRGMKGEISLTDVPAAIRNFHQKMPADDQRASDAFTQTEPGKKYWNALGDLNDLCLQQAAKWARAAALKQDIVVAAEARHSATP